MSITVTHLFNGRRGTALADGTPSGIFKSAVTASIALGPLGLDGDHHADRSVHGGIDKALHHFPAEHYARLAARFPAAAALLEVGSIGENLSSHGLDEHNVCLGDVYALGDARLQLTQPRRPCWKIDQRYDVRGLAAYIAHEGLTGWYYRVLTPAAIHAGMTLELVERDPAAPSVAEFHATLNARRPPLALLARYAAFEALPDALRERIDKRLAWLRRHPPG
jgi:MOSC domain-containing protein YiiM